MTRQKQRTCQQKARKYQKRRSQQNTRKRPKHRQKKAVSVNAAVQGQQGNNTFEINVDMSPVIKIEGGNMDEEKVFEVMKNRIREMADDLGDEIAERMSKIFANMPLIQEA